MKTLLALCVLALSLVADVPSVSGKWNVATSIAGTDNDMVCTFTQKDAAVTGSCVVPQGTVEIHGTVDGGKIAWSYKSEYNGTPLTVKYAGAMASAAQMKGSVEVPEFGVAGEFTANRAE